MTEADKQVLKAQLLNVQALLSTAKTGGAQPILTPTGPAAAPGVNMLAQSLTAAVEQLSKVLTTVIEKS